MKLMQCNKKHYYDGHKFTICPYCTGKTGARAYMGESMDTTKMNLVAHNGDIKYTSTKSVEENGIYTVTEIIGEEPGSFGVGNSTGNK